MRNLMRHFLKKAALRLLRAIGVKKIVLGIIFLIILSLPFMVILTVFGNIAKGDIDGSDNITDEDVELKNMYVIAADRALEIKSSNAEELKYKLHWGLIYAIDMYSRDIRRGDELPFNDLDELAKKLAPRFKYKNSTVTIVTETEVTTVNEEGEEVTETVREVVENDVILLVSAETYRGDYFYEYEWQTTESEANGMKVTITQEVVSGIQFVENYERLDDVIKEYMDLKVVKDDDRTFVIETAFSAGSGVEHFGFLIGEAGYAQFLNIGGVDMTNLPPEWMEAFRKAGEKYGIDWMVLAAVAFVESSFNPNAVGPPNRTGELAQGMMQFLPSTWAIYGLDGDGDGHADPFNPIDAIYSAAYYLSVLGFEENARYALYRYSGGSYVYADKVLSLARSMTFGGGGGGILGWPVPGHTTITSPFGVRTDPATGQPRMHNGVDIGAPKGTPILAVESGTVVQAINGCVEGNRACGGGYGNFVVIRHENGIETLYAHNTQVLVTVGEQVQRGQMIARAGNTGKSFGSHLHLEVRVNGKPVDPMPYLKFSY
jgi:murein DD-endopeptidase MepM/ murein hydrolase activator NlpD